MKRISISTSALTAEVGTGWSKLTCFVRCLWSKRLDVDCNHKDEQEVSERKDNIQPWHISEEEVELHVVEHSDIEKHLNQPEEGIGQSW